MRILIADTPGAAAPNLLRLPYKNIPKTYWPFSDIENYEIPKSIILN